MQALKASVSKKSSQNHDSASSSENLAKALSDLNLKESEIQTLKCNLDGKEAQIVSFEQTISSKYDLIHKIQEEKKEIKDKVSKENARLRRKASLISTKHIL